MRGGGNFVCVRFNWVISGLKFHQPCGVPVECLRRVGAEEKVLLHSGVDFLAGGTRFLVGNQIIDCGAGLNIVAMGFYSFVLYCALSGRLFKRMNQDKVGDFGLVVAVKAYGRSRL